MGSPQAAELVQRICAIYETEILSRKHRVVELAPRKCRPRLMRTFLGYELQLGRKRITCPDLVTAHYLSLFAEIGIGSAAVPYDPTVTAALLPSLETAFRELRPLAEATPAVWRQLRQRMLQTQARLPV